MSSVGDELAVELLLKDSYCLRRTTRAEGRNGRGDPGRLERRLAPKLNRLSLDESDDASSVEGRRSDN